MPDPRDPGEVLSLLFDSILGDILERYWMFEFMLPEHARRPICQSEISEKTLVEPQGGIEVEKAIR
jgi:hypothetical protein